MSDAVLEALRDLIQQDVGGRGLAADPDENLLTATAGDFEAACRSIAAAEYPGLAIVTGFYIPTADPPAAETDGPLGALFLARALAPVGVRVALVTDSFCIPALRAGLAACGLEDAVLLLPLPSPALPDGSPRPAGWWQDHVRNDWAAFARQTFPLTHLVALERVGPGHTAESLSRQPGSTQADVAVFLKEVPEAERGRCRTMRGRDITPHTSPAHLLFEEEARRLVPATTIGIGDGGNEIGMGKVPWRIIRKNIPHGGLIACRVPADHLLVCGVSNWGAYALAAGVLRLLGAAPAEGLLDVERERELLRLMVERGPLVDGVTGRQTVTVDGLPFEQYVEPLRRLPAILAGS